jgi:hypothetical protein
MSEVSVITEALRNEGRKWMRLADQADLPRAAAEGLTLELSAFFIGDLNAIPHSMAYNDFHSYLVNVLRGAVKEFNQIGVALARIADAYDEADKVVSLNLNEIWTPPAPYGAAQGRIS